MCIPESKAKKLPNGTVEDVFNDLPKYAQKLGKQFLLGIQSLHDMNYYWDENGLSKSGKERVEFIIKEYDLKIEL